MPKLRSRVLIITRNLRGRSLSKLSIIFLQVCVLCVCV